jgi:pyridoxal 5'-phosphate synthase pdxT subunit
VNLGTTDLLPTSAAAGLLDSTTPAPMAALGRDLTQLPIGVLALQGDFREHRLTLESLGVRVREVRLPADLEGLAGLIIPGGESTTIGKLMRIYGLDSAIQGFAGAVWGTCAGAIVIAREVNVIQRIASGQPCLGLLDIAIKRNAFGRQVDSFEQDLTIAGLDRPFRAVFIRAPLITNVGAGVEILCQIAEGIVLVRQGRYLASSFHPELTGDGRMHRLFLQLAASYASENA